MGRPLLPSHAARSTDEQLRDDLLVACASHRAELLKAIEPLCGFLRRYTLEGGPPIHRSATAEAIAGRDESPMGNGEVVLKRMRYRVQFESEIANRFVDGSERLSSTAVVAVVAWHTPEAEPFCDASGQTDPGREFLM